MKATTAKKATKATTAKKATNAKAVSFVAFLAFFAFVAGRSYASELISVNADIVEISGSIDTQVGFSWNEQIQFQEKTIPGIIKVGEFGRQTALATTLRLLQTEGKAQLLSSPRVITKSGSQATIEVGGELPYPVTNNQGVGVEFKKFGVLLNILPVLVEGKKDVINADLELTVSNADLSKPVIIANTSVPSLVNRQAKTSVEVKSGETLVIGGLKRSEKTVSKKRVPVLGKIPLLGLLFTTSQTVDQQSSLFLFVTFEVLK